MTLVYVTATAALLRIMTTAAKILICLFAAYFLFKLIRRLLIVGFYNRIKRIVISSKRNIIKRESVPTGYSEGFVRTEHYKYVYKQVGIRYRTKVYFSDRIFIPYTFKDSDRLFLRLIQDAGISLNDIHL